MTLPFLLVATFLSPPSEARHQTSEAIEVYFYLSTSDRSTPEAWRGNRLHLPILAEWVEALETMGKEGNASFVPVDDRETADVTVEIRRCQIQDDGRFVMAGIVDTEVRATPIERHGPLSEVGLQTSLAQFADLVRVLLEKP